MENHFKATNRSSKDLKTLIFLQNVVENLFFLAKKSNLVESLETKKHKLFFDNSNNKRLLAGLQCFPIRKKNNFRVLQTRICLRIPEKETRTCSFLEARRSLSRTKKKTIPKAKHSKHSKSDPQTADLSGPSRSLCSGTTRLLRL